MMPPLVLQEPADGAQFIEGDNIRLQWAPVGPLAADVYYVPAVTFQHLGETWTDVTPWLKEASWALSDHGYLVGLADGGLFNWSVRVMRQTGVDPVTKRPVGVPLSAPSQVRSLSWRASGPAPIDTPIPPENPTEIPP
jgi:hypothetical protein